MYKNLFCVGLAMVVLSTICARIEAGSVVVAQTFTDLPFTGDRNTSPQYDITALGSVDWALWGAEDVGRGFGDVVASPFAPDYSKSGGTAIGALQDIVISTGLSGSGFRSPVDAFGNDGNPGFEGGIEFNWTDGEAPDVSGNSLAAAVFLPNSGGHPDTDKMVVEIDATETPQRLWVFPTSKRTSVDLLAELSDGGSLLLEDLFLESDGDPFNNNDDANGVVALDFVANSPGQTLTLTLSVGTVYDTNNGYGFGLGAVAVGHVPEPSGTILLCLAISAMAIRTRELKNFTPND